MRELVKIWVRWLDDIEEEDLALAGGKALNLARLRQAGFETPNGFVIDMSSLRRADPQTSPPFLPQQALDEIRNAYRQLDAETVAVRSSATIEDSSTRSFAGQARSLLNVRSEHELLEAVLMVYNSTEEAGVRSYVQQKGNIPDDIVMHVVVQEMVDAETSGVVFTINPVSGNHNEMVINAAWGLGDPLVSGKITPDQITADKCTGKSTSYIVGDKEQMQTSDGTRPTPTDKASAHCLDAGQIFRLLEIAQKIEAHFKMPQDIEWAWWQGRLFTLQTRPLTTTSTVDKGDDVNSLWLEEIERLRSLSDYKSKMWVTTGIAELLPCPTPLSWDVASRFMSGNEGYGLAHRRLGYDPAPGSVLERIAGHTYVNLDREAGLFFQQAPLGYDISEILQNPLRATMPRQIFQWRKLTPGVVARLPTLAFRLIRLAVRLRRLRRDYLPLIHGRFLPEFNAYIARERQTDYRTHSNDEVAAIFERRLGHFLTDSSPVLLTGSILAAMSYRDLEEVLIDRLGNEGIELTQRLLTGLSPNPIVEMHEALSRVARGEDSEKEFLNEFGHRCGNEFELASPRWREDTASFRDLLALSRNIGVTARLEKSNNKVIEREETPQHIAETHLSQIAENWGQVIRELLRARLDVAKRLFPLRELTKNYLMMEYELLRMPLVELDRRFRLDNGIFYLHSDEIRSLVNGQEMHELIRSRRLQHKLHQQLQLPQVLLGHQLPESLAVLREAAVGDLKGIGASSGTVEGRVRIIQSIDELAVVNEDEIVVVSSLDPMWTILFTRAAGLVAQRGGILSHGAIVAREYKVPAIVNVPEALSRLRDGQQVKMNGMTGIIQILDREDLEKPRRKLFKNLLFTDSE